jgi:hypothetical protein
VHDDSSWREELKSILAAQGIESVYPQGGLCVKTGTQGKLKKDLEPTQHLVLFQKNRPWSVKLANVLNDPGKPDYTSDDPKSSIREDKLICLECQAEM